MTGPRAAPIGRLVGALAAAGCVALTLCAPALAGVYIGGPITIADSASPPTAASPYPSTVTVSGEKAIVAGVSVRINGLTHAVPDEIDLLLVGPGGQTVLLISDAGATAETNESFTVRDDAPGTLPPGIGLGATIRPTNLDDGTADSFPAPAPAGPFGTSLSALAERGANGSWGLYAVDDTADDAGSIGGWELRISSRDPWGFMARTEPLQPPAGFSESIGSVRVLVERPAVSDLGPGSVGYATVPDRVHGSHEPTPGLDYVPQSGRLEWGALDGSTKAIDIPIIDDAVLEPQEFLRLVFADPAGDVGVQGDTSVSFAITHSDLVRLTPALGGAKVQRVLKQRGVILIARSNVAAAITVTGTIAEPRATTASVRLKTVQRRVAAGRRVKVKLGLSRKTLRTLRRAFSIRDKLRGTVRLTVKDAAGRTKTSTMKLTLTR